MMKIISKREAKEQGLKHYFTGKPCNRGHVTERYTLNSHCCECAALPGKEKAKARAKTKAKQLESLKAKDPRIITREEAKELGLKKYYIGPCLHRHDSERLTSNGSCCECSKEASKQHHEANREKALAKQKKYREANREKELARQKRYREANREAISAGKRRHYEANKDKANQYYKANRKKIRKSVRQHRKDNPLPEFIRRTLERIERGAGVNSKRTMGQIQADIGYTQVAFKQHIESLWSNGMSWDNRKEWHIDHIIPVSQFIKNDITDAAIVNALDNLQPLWATENLSKQDKPVPQAEFDAFIKRLTKKEA